jgi:hypothetical protein
LFIKHAISEIWTILHDVIRRAWESVIRSSVFDEFFDRLGEMSFQMEEQFCCVVMVLVFCGNIPWRRSIDANRILELLKRHVDSGSEEIFGRIGWFLRSLVKDDQEYWTCLLNECDLIELLEAGDEVFEEEL